MDKFDLEDETYCSNEDEDVCVDFVEVSFGDHHSGVKYCGNGELGETRVIGHDEITFEFVSNRRKQTEGFSYTVRCYNSNIEQQVSSSDGLIQGENPSDQDCTRPPDSKLMMVMHLH